MSRSFLREQLTTEYRYSRDEFSQRYVPTVSSMPADLPIKAAHRNGLHSKAPSAPRVTMSQRCRCSRSTCFQRSFPSEVTLELKSKTLPIPCVTLHIAVNHGTVRPPLSDRDRLFLSGLQALHYKGSHPSKRAPFSLCEYLQE